MFKRTTAVNKILSLTKRKKIIQGGSSASKTYSILAILIDRAARIPGSEISVVSESIPHLRRGAIKDFIKIMRDTGRLVEDRWNKSLLTYIFSNGSYIEFFSADQEDRCRGARRQVLYVNEANNIPFDTYHQLAIRTEFDIYLDFNPSGEFWAHTEVFQEEDSQLLVLTYMDNEALPGNVISDFNNARKKADAEVASGVKGYWWNWCQVYIDGQIGSLQGAVFQFKTCDILPPDRKFIAYGLDWGFTSDPTCLVEVSRYNGELYVHQLIYQTGLTNTDIIGMLKALEIKREIIADSAEPKSIEDLRRAGFFVSPAKKGPDSVRNSIDRLQSEKINITKDSVELIKEFRMYRWQTGKDGKQTGEPIDSFNHGIDAVRYVALNKLGVTSEYFKNWI